MRTQRSTARIPRRFTMWMALAVAVVLASFSGCGSSTYEARLAETSKYFGYLHNLDRELSRNVWEESGVSLRLPKEFREAPKPDAADEDTIERWQPSFFGETRPGIAGAFVADVSSKSGTEPCRLYVLSNYNLWLTDETARLARDFQSRVLQQMGSAFGLPEIDSSKLKSVQLPSKASYVEKQTFGTNKNPLHPKEPVFGVDAEIEIYTRTNKDIETVFVLIIPKSTGERVLEKFQLALETLKVESKKPRDTGPDEETGKSKDGGSRKKGGAPAF